MRDIMKFQKLKVGTDKAAVPTTDEWGNSFAPGAGMDIWPQQTWYSPSASNSLQNGVDAITGAVQNRIDVTTGIIQHIGEVSNSSPAIPAEWLNPDGSINTGLFH